VCQAATAFAIQCAHEVASREERWEVLNKRMIMVSAAAAAIQQHHDYLISRLVTIHHQCVLSKFNSHFLFIG
jgi:hypothetical protein